MRVDKPWGHEIIWAHTDKYAGKLLYIRAGESLSLQYHKEKEESIYILSGRLKFEYRDQHGIPGYFYMTPGEHYHILPGEVHRFCAVDDVVLCEVSTPELDDVIRLQDKYGRADAP